MNNFDPSLLVIIGVIVGVLGIIAYVVDQKDVAIAGIGVLGGGVITNYLLVTNQEWQWALLATIIATIMFFTLIKMENLGLGIAAALIGIFGSFLGVVLTWTVDLKFDGQIPVGVLVVIVLAILATVSLLGFRRRRRKTVTTTT